MRGHQIETFKIIEFIYILYLYNYRDFFNISPQTGNLLRQLSKTKSVNQLDFLFPYRVIYFWNKLLSQFKNRNGVKKI